MKTAALLLFCLLLFASPLSATVTNGDSAYGYLAGPVANIPIDTGAFSHAAGSLLIAYCSAGIPGGATVSSVTDTAGDAFIGPATAKRTSGETGWRMEMFYVIASAGNASNIVQCNWSGNVQNALSVAFEFNYTGTYTFDVASTSNPEPYGTTYPTQTFNTTGVGFVFYTAQCDLSGLTGWPPGWTAWGNAAYLITTGPQTGLTPAGSGAAQSWISGAMAFNETGGGGGGATNGRPLILGLRK